jgi:hypothetical protein
MHEYMLLYKFGVLFMFCGDEYLAKDLTSFKFLSSMTSRQIVNCL